MVVNLILKGMAGKRGLMFVTYYGKSRAFISNYRSWRQYDNQGIAAEIAASLLSHETLHLALNKFSLSASAELDNMFGRSNSWENYLHGLGDLDRIGTIKSSPYKGSSETANTRKTTNKNLH